MSEPLRVFVLAGEPSGDRIGADLEALRLRLALYEELSNRSPRPFAWKFDRVKLTALMAKMEAHEKLLAQAQQKATSQP